MNPKPLALTPLHPFNFLAIRLQTSAVIRLLNLFSLTGEDSDTVSDLRFFWPCLNRSGRWARDFVESRAFFHALGYAARFTIRSLCNGRN
jgi:hypothetical protein